MPVLIWDLLGSDERFRISASTARPSAPPPAFCDNLNLRQASTIPLQGRHLGPRPPVSRLLLHRYSRHNHTVTGFMPLHRFSLRAELTRAPALLPSVPCRLTGVQVRTAHGQGWPRGTAASDAIQLRFSSQDYSGQRVSCPVLAAQLGTLISVFLAGSAPV